MVFHAYDKHLVIANEHDMIRYIVSTSIVFFYLVCVSASGTGVHVSGSTTSAMAIPRVLASLRWKSSTRTSAALF